jgi:hypothetical protein
MSDRLDRDRPASIQLTTSNNENKANRLHPFYGIHVWWKAYKKHKSITIKEQQIDQALMIYHVVVSIVLIEIVIEMVKQLTT